MTYQLEAGTRWLRRRGIDLNCTCWTCFDFYRLGFGVLSLFLLMRYGFAKKRRIERRKGKMLVYDLEMVHASGLLS